MNDADYGYDKTSQLTSAVYEKLPEELYDYDANGNRKNFETGANNQLTNDGKFRYTYDDEGNRIAKVSEDTRTEYFWDHRNRLVRVLDNGKSVEYSYDYQNRLVRRNDEFFLHDGWQIALTLDAKGNVKNRYLWGAMQDELLAVDDMWALRDHLNTVRKVVDAKGAVVSELEYNAFGVLINATGEKPLFRYTGKMFDDATGLQWNVNRWYDAKVGRWISEDPIGFEGKDINLSRYVANRAMCWSDPQGLSVPPPPPIPTPFTKAWLCAYIAGLAATATIEAIKWSLSSGCEPCNSSNPPQSCTQPPANVCVYVVPPNPPVIVQVGSEVDLPYTGSCTRRCGTWSFMYQFCCFNQHGTYRGMGLHRCTESLTFEFRHSDREPIPGHECVADPCGGTCADAGFLYHGQKA